MFKGSIVYLTCSVLILILIAACESSVVPYGITIEQDFASPLPKPSSSNMASPLPTPTQSNIPVTEKISSPPPLPSSNSNVSEPSPTPSTPSPSPSPRPSSMPSPDTPDDSDIGPGNLNVQNVTDTGATLLWDKNEAASSYNVYINGERVANDILNNSFILFNLIPNTTYKVEISYINNQGIESPKSRIEFKTLS